MSRYPRTYALLIGLSLLLAAGCDRKNKPSEAKDLRDLNEQTRVYITTESTKVRTGPGPQFRAIADINRDAKVNVVGRDGEWVLIVSKKGWLKVESKRGNKPGYVDANLTKPSTK